MTEIASGTPVVTEMQVIPVAGYDSMLFNLCGAHAPYFTRNIVILKDSAGHTGIGEVPGGEGIRQALERSCGLVVGQSIGLYNGILNAIRQTFVSGKAAHQATGQQDLLGVAQADPRDLVDQALKEGELLVA